MTGIGNWKLADLPLPATTVASDCLAVRVIFLLLFEKPFYDGPQNRKADKQSGTGNQQFLQSVAIVNNIVEFHDDFLRNVADFEKNIVRSALINPPLREVTPDSMRKT